MTNGTTTYELLVTKRYSVLYGYISVARLYVGCCYLRIITKKAETDDHVDLVTAS